MRRALGWLRPAGIGAAAALAVALLWSVTAADDAEWALWRRYSVSIALLNFGLTAAILAAAHAAAAPGQAGTRLRRIALAAASVAFTMGVFELPAVVLGYDYGRRLGVHENDTWLQLALGVNRYDEELLHVHKPHSRYRGVVHGNLARLGIPAPAAYEVDVAYDRNGFRNSEDFESVEVVAVGDSFVEGAEMPESQTVVAQLARRLRVKVANLGQSNYGPQQELAALERYGLPLQPDTVIWFFFGGNDGSDAERYERLRAYPGELLAPQPFAKRSFVRNILRALARATTPERSVASAEARRHSAVFVRRDGSRETIYFDAPEQPLSSRQWRLVEQTLTRAHDLTKQAGADFTLVFIPRKLRVYRGFLQAAPGSVALTWQDNDLPAMLGAWCRARGIGFLDATVPLRSAVAAGVSVHLPDDVHWNAAGHEQLAQAIAAHVTAAAAAGGRSSE